MVADSLRARTGPSHDSIDAQATLALGRLRRRAAAGYDADLARACACLQPEITTALAAREALWSVTCRSMSDVHLQMKLSESQIVCRGVECIIYSSCGLVVGCLLYVGWAVEWS